MSDTKILTSKLSRTMKTGSMAAEAGMRHLNYLGQRFFADNPEEHRRSYEEGMGKMLFRGLSEMRGTALKAAQLLSLEAGMLPEPIRQELAKACYQVPPINRAMVRKVFIGSFGREPTDLFHSFEPEAFAAASLGQVHRAVAHDGRQLAVKVQYPGVAESIDSDLQLFRMLVNGMASATGLMPKRKIIDEAMEEIATCLRDEVNYRKEAESTRWFAERLAAKGIRVPEVYPEYSSATLMSCEFLAGRHIDQWLATEPDQEARNRFGQAIFDCFLHCAFELRALHADPHPGNFLFLDSGGLALLDFGCVKYLSGEFVTHILSAMNALLQGDDEKVLAAYQKLGVLSPELQVAEYREFVQEGLAPMQQRLMAPFQSSPYDFRQIPSMPKMESQHYKRGIKYFHGMSREQIYFDRTHSGIYQLLKKMGAIVVTENPWITGIKSPSAT